MRDVSELLALREGTTPGPWAQSHRKSRHDDTWSTEVFPFGDSDNTIATLQWHSVRTPTGWTTDRQANARAIAAVPDLFAAIEAQAREIAALTARAEDLAFSLFIERAITDGTTRRAQAAEKEAHDCGAERAAWKERAEAAEAKLAEAGVIYDGLVSGFKTAADEIDDRCGCPCCGAIADKLREIGGGNG